MSQQEKSVYFRALKEAGVELDKSYNKYSTTELAALAQKTLVENPSQGTFPGLELPPEQHEPQEDSLPPEPVPTTEAPRKAPVSNESTDEFAGVRLNTKDEDEVIRIDDHGREWLQEEVPKPAYAKRRARRVVQYIDPGFKAVQAGSGGQFETFEVSGDETRPAEIKTTLPTFQTGIYRHPSYPFKIHTYGGKEAFDLFEVRNYFGGADLVPDEAKTVYVSNDLCYDIRTTKRAIERIFRELKLTHDNGGALL